MKMVSGMEWNWRGQDKRGRYLEWNGIEDRKKEDGFWVGMEWERTGEKRTVSRMEWNGKDRRKEDGI